MQEGVGEKFLFRSFSLPAPRSHQRTCPRGEDERDT
jgi:hypothetical protein